MISVQLHPALIACKWCARLVGLKIPFWHMLSWLWHFSLTCTWSPTPPFLRFVESARATMSTCKQRLTASVTSSHPTLTPNTPSISTQHLSRLMTRNIQQHLLPLRVSYHIHLVDLWHFYRRQTVMIFVLPPGPTTSTCLELSSCWLQSYLYKVYMICCLRTLKPIASSVRFWVVRKSKRCAPLC